MHMILQKLQDLMTFIIQKEILKEEQERAAKIFSC